LFKKQDFKRFSTVKTTYLVINYCYIRRRATALAHPKTSSSSSEPDDLPSHWSPILDGEYFQCVTLETISDEYKRTEKKFQDTMDVHHMIIKIERVQNPDLWIRYNQYVLCFFNFLLKITNAGPFNQLL